MLLAQKASYPTVFGVSHYPLLKFRWDNPKNGQDIPKYGRVILALPGSRFTRVWLPCAGISWILRFMSWMYGHNALTRTTWHCVDSSAALAALRFPGAFVNIHEVKRIPPPGLQTCLWCAAGCSCVAVGRSTRL